MFFTYHSVNLVIFVVAVVFSGITVFKLRTPPDTYNTRLFTFGYFSLGSWILWVFQYAIIGAPFVSFPSDSSLDVVLWLAVVQNALWATAVLSLHLKQFSRKWLTFPFLIIFSVVVGLVAYKTDILSSGDSVTTVDALSALTIFGVLSVSIWQLRLGKLSAAIFLIHGYSQWIWRWIWIWLTPLTTTWAVQLIFPFWRIILMIAWFRLISEMRQRVQPAEQKFAALSDQDHGNGTERTKLPNLLIPLRVMISSTVEDLIEEREAADTAIRELQLTRFRAETFGSVAHPPIVVCALLAEQCDIFVLIIGERYGYIMSDGISVVEFEYSVARKQNPEKVLVYVKQGVDREPLLEEFRRRVEDFESGYFRSLFKSADDLRPKVQSDIARWLAYRRNE